MKMYLEQSLLNLVTVKKVYVNLLIRDARLNQACHQYINAQLELARALWLDRFL